MGQFSEDIVAFHENNSKDFDFKTLFRSILDIIQQTKSQIVAGRGIWCQSRQNSCINLKDPTINIDLFQVFIGFQGTDYPLPIRLISAKCFNLFINKANRNDENILEIFQAANTASKTVHANLVDLLRYTSEQSVHIVLECFRNLHKIDKSLIVQSASTISEPILILYQNLHYDIGASRVLIDLMMQQLDFPEGGNTFLKIFIPNCNMHLEKTAEFILTEHQDIPFVEEERQLNLYISQLELQCQALKRVNKNNFEKDLQLQPYEIAYKVALESTNVIAVIKSTVCLKAYMLHMAPELLNRGYKQSIYQLMKRQLNPKETEILSNYIGNIVMITIEKIDQSSSNIELLTLALQKMMKCTLPSTLQGLSLLFSRFLIKSTLDVLNYLSTTQIDTRMGLKIQMDRWLLHQPKFIGKLTKNTTYLGLTKLFALKDKRLESLLVIGFDPSHTQKSPEVSQPLKVLSTIIRCIDNELKINNRELKASEMADKYRNEYNENYNEDGRLNTINDDDDEDADFNCMDLDDEIGDVAVHIQPEYDDIKDDIEARFKKGGFEGVETQSQSIMSAMLGFDEMEGNECDEATEDDLKGLQDEGMDFELVVMLKDFLKKQFEEDYKYMEKCVKQQPNGDQSMFKKHMNYESFAK